MISKYRKNRKNDLISNFFFAVLSMLSGITIVALIIHGVNLAIKNKDKEKVNDYIQIDQVAKERQSNIKDKANSDYIKISNVNSSLSSSPKPSPVTGVSAGSFLAGDLHTAEVFIEKDSDNIESIASITKLVTAIIALNIVGPEKTVEIDNAILSTEGDTAKFRLGERYKVGELLYPLLMVSSNDASEAIAKVYGREQFIKEMNDFALRIGAKNTKFYDPSGLSPENYSTTKDIFTIISWIYENEMNILDITAMKTKSLKLHTWTNKTHFLNMSSYIGGKNGYTEEAERTAISIFKTSKGRPLAIIVLRSNNRDKDVLGILKYFESLNK